LVLRYSTGLSRWSASKECVRERRGVPRERGEGYATTRVKGRAGPRVSLSIHTYIFRKMSVCPIGPVRYPLYYMPVSCVLWGFARRRRTRSPTPPPSPRGTRSRWIPDACTRLQRRMVLVTRVTTPCAVALLTAECSIRDRRGPCLAPPEGELHGLAAPDWRGEIRVGRTSTLSTKIESRLREAPPG
jgi:hypothetical protein